MAFIALVLIGIMAFWDSFGSEENLERSQALGKTFSTKVWRNMFHYGKHRNLTGSLRQWLEPLDECFSIYLSSPRLTFCVTLITYEGLRLVIVDNYFHYGFLAE